VLDKYVGGTEEKIAAVFRRADTLGEALIIDEAFFALSSQQRAAALEGVDALITRQRHTCIGVSTADCVPILLFDQKQRIGNQRRDGRRK